MIRTVEELITKITESPQEAYELIDNNSEQVISLFNFAQEVLLFAEKARPFLFLLINKNFDHFTNLFKDPDEIIQLARLHENIASQMIERQYERINKLFINLDKIILLASASGMCALDILSRNPLKERADFLQTATISNILLEYAKTQVSPQLTVMFTSCIPAENRGKTALAQLVGIMEHNSIFKKEDILRVRNFSVANSSNELNEGLTEEIYKYRLVVNDGHGFSARHNHRVTEYYVPSSGICFNQYVVFKSEKPRNDKNMNNNTHPITIIKSSCSLIEQIKLSVSKESIDEALAYNEEFKQLLHNPLFTKTVGHGIYRLKDIDVFEISYPAKGNNVIKKALVKYILDGVTPENYPIKLSR